MARYRGRPPEGEPESGAVMRCLLPVETSNPPPVSGGAPNPAGRHYDRSPIKPLGARLPGHGPSRRRSGTLLPVTHAPECGGESPKPPRRVLGERPYHSRTARTALAGRPPPSALIGPRLDRTPMPRGDHRSREREGVRAGYSIFIPVFFQSARKPARPESVSGCLVRLLIRLAGMVATSAPIIAACLT